MGGNPTKLQVQLENVGELVSSGRIKFDVCYLDNFKQVRPKAPDSSSNTQIVFANMIIHRGKIHDYYIPVVMKSFFDNPKDNSLLAEAQIYINWIRKLIIYKVSPCFINVVGFRGCPGLLNNIKKENIGDFEYSVLQTGIKRITTEMINQGVPFVANSSKEVNMLVIESAQNALKFSDWLTSPDCTEEHLVQVLFQLLYTLLTMQYYKIVHNDLHPGNFFISKLPKKKRFVFAWGNKQEQIAIIETKFLVQIYDWDRGSAPGIKNSHLDKNDFYCIEIGECDDPINFKRDLYLPFCSIGKHYIGSSTPKFISDFISRNFSAGLIQYVENMTSKSRAPCRIRSSDPGVGAFIPPDYSPNISVWMNGIDRIFQKNDILISSQTVKSKNNQDELLIVDTKDIYAVYPELRLEIIGKIEKQRLNLIQEIPPTVIPQMEI